MTFTVELTASQSLIEVARILAGLSQQSQQLPQATAQAPYLAPAMPKEPKMAQSTPETSATAVHAPGNEKTDAQAVQVKEQSPIKEETKTAYSVEERRKLVIPFIRRNRQSVVDLLKKYEAASITELDADKFEAFFAELKSL